MNWNSPSLWTMKDPAVELHNNDVDDFTRTTALQVSNRKSSRRCEDDSCERSNQWWECGHFYLFDCHGQEERYSSNLSKPRQRMYDSSTKCSASKNWVIKTQGGSTEQEIMLVGKRKVHCYSSKSCDRVLALRTCAPVHISTTYNILLQYIVQYWLLWCTGAPGTWDWVLGICWSSHGISKSSSPSSNPPLRVEHAVIPVLRKVCNRATAIQMARLAMTVTVQHWQ